MLAKINKLGAYLDRAKALGEPRPFAFQPYIRKQEEGKANMRIIVHHSLEVDEWLKIKKMPSFQHLPPDSIIFAKSHWMILFTCSKMDYVEEYRKWFGI